MSIRDVRSSKHTKYKKTTANYTVVNEEVILVDTTGGAVTITLPPTASTMGRREIQVVDIGGAASSNNITVSRAGADTINGSATDTISSNYGAQVYIDSTTGNWVKSNLSGGSIARTSLATEAAVVHPVELTKLRKVATISATLPATDDATSPGLVNGTYLTSNPTVQTSDVKAAGSVTRTARFQFALPEHYVPAGAIKVRINAGMLTSVADTTATVAINCVRIAAPTVDINSTSAISINSLTAADCDFTLTTTGCVVGDILDVKITIAINDGATGTAVIGKINKVSMLLATEG